MNKNILFIQFYSIMKNRCALYNGFSNVYEDCKNNGDLLWVELNIEDSHDLTKWSYERKWDMNKFKKNDLPISKGTVYVSTFWHPHVLQAYVWAKKYPDIKFIVGGPPIMLNPYTPDDTVPDNLILKKGLAEKIIFKKNIVSTSWDINLPPKRVLKNIDTIEFTYLIDRRCYWKKCIFCKYYRNIEEPLNRPASKLFLPDNSKKYFIFLQMPSMSPGYLMAELPKLNKSNNIKYAMFLRGNDEIISPLEKTLHKCSMGNGPNPKRLAFSIGVEFPSNRMLKYINKGATTNSILKTINLLKQYGCTIGINLIRDWNNLTEEDVTEAEKFFNKLYSITNNDIIIGLTTLIIVKGTPLDKIYRDSKKSLTKNPFDIGISRPILNKKQKILNDEYNKMFKNFTIYKGYTNK